ncbi:zinc-binding dehydrogenase [Nocardioides sp. J54]|uniref:zinc-binding dehydrogenase n=1 Tax=Nocardioides sp. J54 TaxID=935866 RepID=UPI00048EE7D4|nr:zinc-binding dehydrogenase [Nocardioides sp. J54]
MKAWQFTGPGEPLVLAEVPVPEPGAGEVLVEIRAAGLCHTDVGILDDPGWLSQLAPRPLTLGHEVAGVVVALGEGVEDVALGARVGISPAGRTRPGLGQGGGYASHCLAFPEDLIPIPDGVGFAQAAAGTDAGKTARHAVGCRGQVEAGQKVAVIGLGGIGQVATRLAVLRGADVVVAEPREDLWPIAKELGAARVVGSLAEVEESSLDTVIDLAGVGVTTNQAISAVRKGGRVVQVGMARLEATISTRDLIVKQVDLLGSSGGSTADIADVYGLMATGDLDPILPTIGFDDIPDGLDRLRRGEVVGRLVAVYGS